MWFHHVRQSPDDKGCTIAVNYCKDKIFFLKGFIIFLCFRRFDTLLSYFLQGMICNLTSSMRTLISYNLLIIYILEIQD